MSVSETYSDAGGNAVTRGRLFHGSSTELSENDERIRRRLFAQKIPRNRLNFIGNVGSGELRTVHEVEIDRNLVDRDVYCARLSATAAACRVAVSAFSLPSVVTSSRE